MDFRSLRWFCCFLMLFDLCLRNKILCTCLDQFFEVICEFELKTFSLEKLKNVLRKLEDSFEVV